MAKNAALAYKFDSNRGAASIAGIIDIFAAPLCPRLRSTTSTTVGIVHVHYFLLSIAKPALQRWKTTAWRQFRLSTFICDDAS